MRKICFYNKKGGVGKSTLAINVAGILEKRKYKKVLFIDCDSQANSSGLFLANSPEEPEYSLCDFLEGRCDLASCSAKLYVQTRYGDKETQITCIRLDKSEMSNYEPSSLEVFKNALKPYEDEFDYCILDFPPKESPIAEAALACVDYVIIPTECNRFSIEGIVELANQVKEFSQQGINENIRNLGTVAVKYKKQSKGQNIWLNAFRQTVGESGMMFDTTIRSSTVVEQSMDYCEPVCYFEPNHVLVEDVFQFVSEMERKIEVE